MKKIATLLLAFALPVFASAQLQLVSGYNFGQFLNAGGPYTDGLSFEENGYIGANWAYNDPPPLSSSGDNFGAAYTNGTGTLYWNGTAGSSNLVGTGNVVAYDNPAFSLNAYDVDGTLIALVGDHGGANMALDVKGAFSIGFQQDMSGYSDAGGTDLTFAAQATFAPITITWTFNGNIVATTDVGTDWAVYTVDLPADFFGLSIAELTATFSGAGRLDNVQFYGYFGLPPAPALTFWKGGDGLWTVATTPENWTDEAGSESGVWASGLATFQGTPGTVTVDTADGAVPFSGIIFEVDGYTVAGDALTTTTAATTLQVGDGTAGSSAMTATISAPITGTGGIDKTDLGTLVLSGANTYSGTTTVSAGTLAINGDQSSATGAVTVASGATLGGIGTLGGAVTVHDGGSLTGVSGSTLTMAGLTLSSTANLNVKLGAPGTTKLFQINGDLTLDGLLNVTSTVGFGGGLYRLIDFTGTLTDNGLSIGAVPGSLSDFTIQTSVANQVNLIVDVSSLFWGGGSGTWSAGGAGWQNVGGGAATWSPNFAIFQSPSGTVIVDDVDGAVVFEGIQFAATGYTVTGDDLTTNTAGTSVRVGDGTSAGAAMTATVSAAITGSGGIDKRDLGTLVLAGTNTYSGGTTVSEGTLQIGSGGATGSVLGDITNNATLAFNRSDDFTFDGVISGTGAVVKQGSGTTTLTGANTYSGGTTVNAGILQGVAASLQGAIVNNAAVVFDQAAAGTYAGAMSGTGALSKQGTGTLSLTGANTFTGGTTVTAGTLQIGNGGTTGSLAGSITNNATVAFDRSDDYTHSGILSGVGLVVIQGSGTTTLAGANTYTGATSVNAGKLLIDGDQSAATGVITVASGGTLGGTGTHGGGVVIEDGGILSGATGSTFTFGDLTLNAGSNVNITLGAPGTTELFKVDGDLTLDGLLNVTAGTGFAEGLTRLFSYTGNLSNNDLSIGTVAGNSDAYTVQTSTAGVVSLFYSPSIAPLYWAGGSGTWSSDASGTGWGNTNDTWTTGFALFDGTPGTVTIASTSTDPVVVTGVQFAVDGYVVTGTTLTTNTANTPFRVGDGTSAGTTMTATISAPITGSGGVDKTDVGTLVLTGTNTYTGGTRVSAGILQVSADSALGATSGALQLNGGTLRAGANFTSARAVTISADGSIDTAASNLTLSGIISGTGNLTKTGAGTLTVSGDSNTHTGTTTIAAGTIALAGSAGSLGSTNISSGASLTGNGTIRGDLTNSGTLSPGVSAGAISVTGNYTQNSTGSFAVELASATSFDQLFVTGAASLGGNLTVTTVNGFTPKPGDTFMIIDAAGGVSGMFASVTSPFAYTSAMQRFEIFYNATDVTLSLTQLSFAELEGTPNQIATGAAVDGALASDSIPELGAALNALQTEDEVRAALTQLSPLRYERWFDQAVHSASALVRTAESHMAQREGEPHGVLWSDHVRRQSNNAPEEESLAAEDSRPKKKPGAQSGLWAEVVRRQSDYDAEGESLAAEGTANGIIVGGDVAVSRQLQLGLLFGYTDEDIKIEGPNDSTAVSRFTGAAYARYETFRWFLEGIAGASYSQLESTRSVDIEGANGVAEGSSDGRETFVSVRAGLHLRIAAARLTPYAAVQHTGVTVDEFVETGAGDANLTVRKQSEVSLASRVGLKLAFPMKGESIMLTPSVDVAWRNEFQNDARELTAAFGGSEFTVQTRQPPSNGLIAGIGLDALFASGLTVYTRFSIERNTAADEGFSARAGMDFRF